MNFQGFIPSQQICSKPQTRISQGATEQEDNMHFCPLTSTVMAEAGTAVYWGM